VTHGAGPLVYRLVNSALKASAEAFAETFGIRPAALAHFFAADEPEQAYATIGVGLKNGVGSKNDLVGRRRSVLAALASIPELRGQLAYIVDLLGMLDVGARTPGMQYPMPISLVALADFLEVTRRSVEGGDPALGAALAWCRDEVRLHRQLDRSKHDRAASRALGACRPRSDDHR